MDLSSAPGALRPHRAPSWLDRFAERALRRQLSTLDDGALTVTLPSGHRFVCGSAAHPHRVEWSMHKWNALFRAAQSGALGFAEGYIHDEWSTPDLSALLILLARHLDNVKSAHSHGGLSRLAGRIQHMLNANTRSGSKRNIAFHYDLGNEFYADWLDPSMTYSAALYESDSDTLEAAQTRKYRRICEQLALSPGDHVLEIGCGWGSFAEIAARDFGLKVTGVTLSKEQLAYARDRIERAGLSDQVELRLQDYRDIEGEFDGIASIEMFEAVGEAHWPTFFETVSARLKPGARAALQIITIRDADFDSYRRTADFIQKYIFPGGMLPTIGHVETGAQTAGLEPADRLMFADGYARTLAEWHTRYSASWSKIAARGFDSRFDRTWRFYLAYCEAGFRAGRIDVGHFTLRKP